MPARLVGAGLLILFVLVAFMLTRPIPTVSVKLDLPPPANQGGAGR